MFRTPRRLQNKMVGTRSTVRREHEQEKLAMGSTGGSVHVERPPPSSTIKSEVSKMKKTASETSSAKVRRAKLLLEAAKQKAQLQMELIDKKLAVDLAELDSHSSRSLNRLTGKELSDRVEKWLETSQEVKTQCVTIGNNDDALSPAHQQVTNLQLHGAVGPLPPATEPALTDIRIPPPTTTRGGTEGTMHTLECTLKDLAATTTSSANQPGTDMKMLNRLCTPRNLPRYDGDPLECLQYEQAWDHRTITSKLIDGKRTLQNIKDLRLPRYYVNATQTTATNGSATATIMASTSIPATSESDARDAGYTGTVGVSETHGHPSASAPNSANAGHYTNLQLHIFCDASTQAMRATAYLRWNDHEQNIQVSALISSKPVAPMKYVSMLRVELQTTLMGARLADTLSIIDKDLECVNTLYVTPVYLPPDQKPEVFSSWLQLLRSTCVFLSFIDNCRRLTCTIDGVMMDRAERLFTKHRSTDDILLQGPRKTEKKFKFKKKKQITYLITDCLLTIMAFLVWWIAPRVAFIPLGDECC